MQTGAAVDARAIAAIADEYKNVKLGGGKSKRFYMRFVCKLRAPNSVFNKNIA